MFVGRNEVDAILLFFDELVTREQCSPGKLPGQAATSETGRSDDSYVLTSLAATK
jgi:hypothetical protein